jgi:hypothetical protein
MIAANGGESKNIAIGAGALAALDNDGDNYNIAIGHNAGNDITTGGYNTIIGGLAGDALTDGLSNTAVGYQALSAETGGDENVAIGIQALQVSNGGSGNTVIGRRAGNAVSSGDNNVIIGRDAGGIQGGSNNIVIGKDAAASAVDVSNETVIGTTTTTSALVHGLKQPVTAVTSNIAAAATTPNTIYRFNDADGATVTLPDSGDGSQIGKSYEFVITVTATSNRHDIVLTDQTNERFIGNLILVDTDSSDAITADAALVGDDYVEIQMNGTTQGIKGTYIKCTNVAADLWLVQGTVLCTGNPSSPFA